MRTRSCIFHVLRRCEDEQKGTLKQDATKIYRVVKQGRLAPMTCRCIGSDKIGVHTCEQFDSGLTTNNVGSTDTLYQSNTESNIQSSQHWHTGFIHLILKLYTFGYICQRIPPSLLNFQRKLMNLNEVGTTSAPLPKFLATHAPCAQRLVALWMGGSDQSRGVALFGSFSLFIMLPKGSRFLKRRYESTSILGYLKCLVSMEFRCFCFPEDICMDDFFSNMNGRYLW